MSKVKKDDIVRVEYTGTLEDGTVFDKSEDRCPLIFKVGAGQVIPGFDEGVTGMEKGEEKEIKIPSKKAYGQHREELIRDVPRQGEPEGFSPKVGDTLGLRAPTGQALPAKVVEVHDDKLKLDMNHPLAGKNLTLKIKVTGINEEGDKDPMEATAAGCSDNDCSGCGSDCGHN